MKTILSFCSGIDLDLIWSRKEIKKSSIWTDHENLMSNFFVIPHLRLTLFIVFSFRIEIYFEKMEATTGWNSQLLLQWKFQMLKKIYLFNSIYIRHNELHGATTTSLLSRHGCIDMLPLPTLSKTRDGFGEIGSFFHFMDLYFSQWRVIFQNLNQIHFLLASGQSLR